MSRSLTIAAVPAGSALVWWSSLRSGSPPAVLYDEKSPAASLATAIENAGVKLTPVNASEHAQACGMFYDAVDQRTVRHLGTPELVAALRGVAKRPLSDAWAWSRKNSTVDISPLVAVTLALWGLEHNAESVYESRGLTVLTLD
jgi:hypothetical protein